MESWLDRKAAELWLDVKGKDSADEVLSTEGLAARLAKSSTVRKMSEELKELEPLESEAPFTKYLDKHNGTMNKVELQVMLSTLALEISLTAIFREMNKLALFKRIDGGGKKGNVTLKGLSQGIPKSKLLETLGPFIEELRPFRDPSVYEKELKEADGLEESDGCVSQSEFVKVSCKD